MGPVMYRGAVCTLSDRGRPTAAMAALPTLCLFWFVGWYKRAPISWTKRGYRDSVIFSLFANSRARSKGIQTPLRCIGPILTTCLVFSLLRMPSLRPLVMPATLRSLVPLIMWLSSRRATHTPFASTWKQRLPSSSHNVAVTRGFMPGGATCPVWSNVCDW